MNVNANTTLVDPFAINVVRCTIKNFGDKGNSSLPINGGEIIQKILHIIILFRFYLYFLQLFPCSERCQCFGHADECFFDPQVEAERRSLNTEGKFEGGGVCIGCRHHTAGINCEYCKEGKK